MTIPSWLRSSANPDNISLFFKGLAAVAVLVGIDPTVITNFGDSIVQIIVAIGVLISALTAVIGAVRKIQLGRWSAPTN